VLNYLVRLGWSHGDQEIFSIEEMVRLFDIADVNKSASAFNFEKLAWLNQQHMMQAPLPRMAAFLRWHLEREGIVADVDARLEQIVLVQRERAKTLKEMAANSLFFFRAPVAFDEKAKAKHVTPDIVVALSGLAAALDKVEDWSAPVLHALIGAFAAEKGLSLGKLAQPIRLAVCGGTVSPPIDATLAILGQEETLTRLTKALAAWNG
jgi:glutamyl-tRNA synthetase